MDMVMMYYRHSTQYRETHPLYNKTGGLSIVTYTKEERLEIGRRIYNNELTKDEASEQYGISTTTARTYMHLYRNTNKLPIKNHEKETEALRIIEKSNLPEYESYASMTKEQLIRELVKVRINEARLKKGYEVKGDGAEKVFIPIDNKNTK